MFASHTFLPATSDIPLNLGRKYLVYCFGGEKHRDFEPKGFDQCPRGTTTGMGRERESRERDGSHKCSRNYSREPRERKPLIMKGYERCSKMLRIWRKNSLKRVLSFSREYWVYFDIT